MIMNVNKRSLYGNFQNVFKNKKCNNSYLFVQQYNTMMDIVWSKKRQKIKSSTQNTNYLSHVVTTYFNQCLVYNEF